MTALDPFTRRALRASAAASLVCLALLGARLLVSHEGELLWLVWNLLLAWVPLVAALAAVRAGGGGARDAVRLPLLAAWLLFLPNAPYLITDLIHLEGRTAAALAMDVPLFGAFAATGVLIFLVSLRLIHRMVLERAGARPAAAVVAACVWLASAGMYLGRVLRWNSWDVVVDPARRLGELASHLGEPSDLALAAAFVVAFGVALTLAWSAFGALAGRRGAARPR